MGRGHDFERELAKGLQERFPDAFVHRFKQTKNKGVKQPFDIEIIWPYRTSIVVECKSKKVNDRKTIRLPELYYDKWPDKYYEQIEDTKRTNLIGIYAFEWRFGSGRSKEAYYTPLRKVEGKRVTVDEPNSDVWVTKIMRDGTKYIVPENFPWHNKHF